MAKWMDLNILRLTYFLILERRALALFSLMERWLTWYCQRRFVSIFTVRHLTLSVEYSLLPHNFIFKWPSDFFCLGLKITISVFFTLSEILFAFNHSHKKRKDSLESSLDRVLFAAELEFPKILVPRLPQHASNVNIECAGKSEWSKLYIWSASWSTDTS